MQFIDLVGKKFGRLLVIKRVENTKNGSSRWLCKCDCGKRTITTASHLKSGHTKSCGCLSKEVAKQKAFNNKYFYKHGLSKDETFRRISYIRTSMKSRCYKPTNNEYKYYGGRGIKVCNEWLDEENGVMNFYNWSINNGYKNNLSIDRIDVNGNYEPNNCRWATPKEQARNKTNNIIIKYNNKTIKLIDAAEKLGINPRILRDRLRRGWTVERTIEKYPSHNKKVSQYDLQGNFIKTFDSIKEAQKETNISSISTCCRGICKTAGGYIWRYANEDNNKFTDNNIESN